MLSSIARRAFIAAIAALGLASVAGASHAESFALSVQPIAAGGIAIEAGEAGVRWYCGLSKDDPTLCRGRADDRPTVLRFFDAAPVTFRGGSLMLYRSRGRVVAIQLEPAGSRVDAMTATWAPLIRNRRDTSAREGRVCGPNDAATAIAAAQAFFNAPEASICADDGAMQISWKFARPHDAGDPRLRVLSLTVSTPELVGRKSHWLSSADRVDAVSNRL